MLLSILIPSIPERADKLAALLARLKPQVDRFKGEVEVLALVDLRTMELGEKRNRLMEIAHGTYLINLDDDDRLVDDALDVLMPLVREEAHTSYADVIAYDQRCYLELRDGSAEFTVRTSMAFDNEMPEVVDGKWKDIRRKPWHWCCWRTSFALNYEFKGRVDEDAQWLTKAWPNVTLQRKLDKVLHEYHFSATDSLCQAVPT
jgi:glycosyltransferase involved in cell wall biosynthesis